MTKYRTLTDEELIRLWDSLEPIYLLAEAKLRIERLIDGETDIGTNLKDRAAELDRREIDREWEALKEQRAKG